MYRLYYYPGNANLAPHVLLEEASAQYELVLVDRETGGQKDADYLRLNPNGRVPTLVDGELVLFEAAAICLHIADGHPEADLLPAHGSPDRSHFYKWLIFLTNTIQPDYMAFRYPENYTADPSGIPAVRRQAELRLATGFAVLDGALHDNPYLVGQ
ncbi:MAG: glutathione S-transferase, partial [Gammaproteobacteria bacterium]|nr:glutathione S-transferase [Gammaproteobacteria bacterium]